MQIQRVITIPLQSPAPRKLPLSLSAKRENFRELLDRQKRGLKRRRCLIVSRAQPRLTIAVCAAAHAYSVVVFFQRAYKYARGRLSCVNFIESHFSRNCTYIAIVGENYVPYRLPTKAGYTHRRRQRRIYNKKDARASK